MRKQNGLRYALLWMAMILIASLPLAACSPTSTSAAPTQATIENVSTQVTSNVTVEATSPVSVDTPSVEEIAATATPVVAPAETSVSTPSSILTEVEIDGLVYMREEEKLARDVYLTLYNQWQLPIFKNIASSEQTHTDSVKTLLDRYNIEDPVKGKDIGEFTNRDLQALYNQLVETGQKSLADALKVGAAIEEIDILDLEERIAQTNNPDIQTVYENLMRGSRNHLRAFVSTLETQTGEVYQPQYLSQKVYDSIISSDTEKGGPGGGSGGHGNGG